jgi:DNA-binding LacI/PurR family transcriptional regulator
VAYVAGREDTSTNIEREHAFTRSAAELGLVLAARVSTGEYSYEAGYRAAIEVGRSGADAIFFANDILAVGGLDALRDEVGLKVPEDISVVGFDDIGMARWPRYQLTTVRQPVERMLDTAIGLLPQSSREPAEAPALHRIPGELVVRRTTSPREARS